MTDHPTAQEQWPEESLAAYRKKPVTINAVKYTLATRADIISWLGDNVQHQSVDDDGALYDLESLRIQTLEGVMYARLGDFIIRGVKGEFYPCKPDIFEQTYESVGALRPTPEAPDPSADETEMEVLRAQAEPNLPTLNRIYAFARSNPMMTLEVISEVLKERQPNITDQQECALTELTRLGQEMGDYNTPEAPPVEVRRLICPECAREHNPQMEAPEAQVTHDALRYVLEADKPPHELADDVLSLLRQRALPQIDREKLKSLFVIFDDCIEHPWIRETTLIREYRFVVAEKWKPLAELIATFLKGDV